MPKAPEPVVHRRLARLDLLLMLLLGLSAVAGAWSLSRLITPAVYGAEAEDVWFDYDLDEALGDMTNRFSSDKSSRHPLFSILTFPPTRLLVKAAGMEPLTAALATNAAIAGCWAALLFALLRGIGCRRLDAGLLTLLGAASAAGVFLFSVAETFVLGSVTILLSLLWAQGDEAGRRSRLGEMAIAAATLGVTLTNWMVGAAAAALRRRPVDAGQVILGSLGLTAAVWTAGSMVFPNQAFFLGHRYETERTHYFWSQEAGGPARILTAIAVHPVVMPALQVVDRPGTGRWELLSVQDSDPGSAGWWGRIALAAWLPVLGFGMVAISRHRGSPRFRLLVGVCLLGQVALHLVFGYETFMYSPHWLPLLLVLAGFATLTRWRGPVVGLLSACLVASGVNNLRQFHLATGFLRGEEQLAARRRLVEPAPVWPGGPLRQVGPLVHFPGNRFWEDGAPERSGGGGLWPAFDSFYIGFRVVDAAGRVVLESSDTTTGLFRFTTMHAPGGEQVLRTEGRYYRATWRSGMPGRWRLDLEVLPEAGTAVEVAVRGIGWQFSRIKELRRDSTGITVNGRWTLRLSPPAASVLGEEDGPGWRTAPDQGDTVRSAIGMGFVRLGPLRPGTFRLLVEDSRRGLGSNELRRTLAYGSPE